MAGSTKRPAQDSVVARLRDLPSVGAALEAPEAEAMIERFGRARAARAARGVVAEARQAIRAGDAAPPPDAGRAALRALARLEAEDRGAGLRPAFNLTGTVLHTNLGRAILARAAIEAAQAAMAEHLPLEFDLASGRRGERDDHLRDLLRELTGAEDATVVNNNAAAVLLCLNTLAEGREAIVSRGELIEIGGAFRMPQIMARAGVKLVEVGTTNRTHLQDYRAALSPATGVILKVHPSNFQIVGFTCGVAGRDLAALADAAKTPLLHDLGSGTLVDLRRYGLGGEMTVAEAVAQGAGLVTFSGDKLLGGPQAGFIVGRRELVAAVNRNPMKRALRVDKIRLAAMAATLKLYRDPDRLAKTLPTLRFLTRTKEDVAAAAERLAPPLARALGEKFDVARIDCASQIGSGALPVETIASAGLAVRPRAGGGGALDRLAAAFRALERPAIGRVEEGALVFDLRCLSDEEGFVRALDGLDRDALA